MIPLHPALKLFRCVQTNLNVPGLCDGKHNAGCQLLSGLLATVTNNNSKKEIAIIHHLSLLHHYNIPTIRQ